MIMSAKALPDQTAHPTEALVRQGLAGNLWRCGTHGRIIRAVLKAGQSTGRI
jgi:nicotinate dehydrogenase subunit A